MDHHVIGVVGASGGLGTSTLAVAVALRAARGLGATTCVDADFAAGGLDVTACLEHRRGVRWADLAAARGDLDGAALLRALPHEGSMRVLAARGQPPADEVASAAVRALRQVCAVTVLDLGRDVALAPLCTDLVVVSGESARHLADALALAPRVAGQPTPAHLLLRAGRHLSVSPEEMAIHLDLPVLGILRDDAQTAADADRARVPGSREGGVLARAADQVLAGLVG